MPCPLCLWHRLRSKMTQRVKSSKAVSLMARASPSLVQRSNSKVATVCTSPTTMVILRSSPKRIVKKSPWPISDTWPKHSLYSLATRLRFLWQLTTPHSVKSWSLASWTNLRWASLVRKLRCKKTNCSRWVLKTCWRACRALCLALWLQRTTWRALTPTVVQNSASAVAPLSMVRPTCPSLS